MRQGFRGIQSPNDLPDKQKMKRGKVGCKRGPFAGAIEGTSLPDAIPAFDIQGGKGLDRPSNFLKVKCRKMALFQGTKPAQERVRHHLYISASQVFPSML